VTISYQSAGPFTIAGQFYGVEKKMNGLYKDKQGIAPVRLFVLLNGNNIEVLFLYLLFTLEKKAKK